MPNDNENFPPTQEGLGPIGPQEIMQHPSPQEAGSRKVSTQEKLEPSWELPVELQGELFRACDILHGGGKEGRKRTNDIFQDKGDEGGNRGLFKALLAGVSSTLERARRFDVPRGEFEEAFEAFYRIVSDAEQGKGGPLTLYPDNFPEATEALLFAFEKGKPVSHDIRKREKEAREKRKAAGGKGDQRPTRATARGVGRIR